LTDRVLDVRESGNSVLFLVNLSVFAVVFTAKQHGSSGPTVILRRRTNAWQPSTTPALQQFIDVDKVWCVFEDRKK
jgi:hypothetical protein